MADFDILRESIQQFSFTSMPTNGDNSSPPTVGDVKKVVANLEVPSVAAGGALHFDHA